MGLGLLFFFHSGIGPKTFAFFYGSKIVHNIISEILQLPRDWCSTSKQGLAGKGTGRLPLGHAYVLGPVPWGWCCLAMMCVSKMCSSGAREESREAHNQYNTREADMFVLFLS